MMHTFKLSIKKAFIKLICSALLIVGSGSVYAACIVDGTSYDVGGTGLTSVSGAGGAITRTIIKDDWDTTDDDVSTCDVSNITDMSELFFENASFNDVISTWDVSNVTTMFKMFREANAFNQDISLWDVSKVATMSEMFRDEVVDASNRQQFNQDISPWNVSSVRNMSYMFNGASVFNNGNAALDWGHTSSVTNMENMFRGASTFNLDISDWNVAAVTNMQKMFRGADDFNNGGVALDWSDTSKVTNMYEMFRGATVFNQDISDWNVAAVTNMQEMFKSTNAFNQDISGWNVAAVTSMNQMFRDADDFNNGGVALDWSDTSKVTNMYEMFRGATVFNQDVSTSGNSWNVAEVITMYRMFKDADAFNQDISSWDVSKVTAMDEMFYGVTLSTANYDALLIGWDALELWDNVTFHAGSSKYTASSVASTARASIISTDSWTITPNSSVADSSVPTLSSSTPADGATGVAVDANIELTFSEIIYVKTGNITIKKSSDGSTVETIDVTSGLVTGTGTTTITINPSTTLDEETGYYLNIALTAFDDTASNSYAGITNATTLNFTTVVANLPTPLDKKDVISSIESWSNTSSRWVESSSDSALGRIDWLNRHKGSTKTSHQGIQLIFVDTLINKIMNNSPGAALSDIDFVDAAASLIGDSSATFDEVSDNAEQKATDIAINEAVRLREGLIGSLNPSFGPVTGNWSVWTEGRVVIGKTDASTTASKKEIEIQAFALGIDRPIGSGDELIGFVLSVGQDDTDIGTAKTNVKSNNYSLSNYNVFKTSSGVQLESVFGLGHLDFDTTRTDGSDTLTGTRKAHQLFFSSVFRPQKNIHIGSWQLSPYSKVSVANTRLNSFSESGALTALTFDKQELRDAAVGVGFDINTQIKTDNHTIKPFAKLEYARSSSKTSASMHYNNEDVSTYSYTTSLNTNTKNWKMKLGLDFNTKSGWDMSVSYMREQSISSSADKKNSNSFSLNAGTSF